MSELDLSLLPDGLPSLYTLAHSILVREGVVFSNTSAPPGDSQWQIPCTLLPSPFPRPHYQAALSAQKLVTRLYHRAARDHLFVQETMEAVLSDEFMRKLCEVFKTTRLARESRPAAGILRSDYMLHCSAGRCEMKQVEVNTIAVSLSSISQRVQNAHCDIARILNRRATPPLNEAADRTAELLALARDEYARSVPTSERPCVLMVAADSDANRYDKEFLRAQLLLRHGARMVRRSLRELEGTITSVDGRLSLDGLEVGVCYYREGYKPEDYSEKSWELRTLMEASKAIQIPDIAMQLCGTKRMQQRLTDPSVVSRFLPDASREECEGIVGLFARQFSLAPSPEGDALVAEATRRPDQWVLKPQREGGGNNFFGEEMAAMLRSLDGEERGAYILMERLTPPLTPNYLLTTRCTNGMLTRSETIQEVGVFGMFVARGPVFSHDITAGYVFRTKDCRTEDGGVCSGRAHMDSIHLVDTL